MIGHRFRILTLAPLIVAVGCTPEAPRKPVDLSQYQIKENEGGPPCFEDESGKLACAPMIIPDNIFIKSDSLDGNTPKTEILNIARAHCESKDEVLSFDTMTDDGAENPSTDIEDEVRWQESVQSWMMYYSCVQKPE